MSEVIQYRKVLELQYSLDNGQMKIKLEGTDDNYFANLDEIDLNPGEIDLSYFEINKSVVKIRFTDPIICDVKSGKYFSSMTCGAKFSGINKGLFVENIGGLKSKMDSFVDGAVEVRKEKMESESED